MRWSTAVLLVFPTMLASAQSTSTGLPALKEELADEAAVRSGADTLLESRIAGEEARAQLSEQDLRAADAQLQTHLDASGSALAAEQRARAAADTEAQGVLAAEMSARAQADLQLTADLAADRAAQSLAVQAVGAQHTQELAALGSELRSSITRERSSRQKSDDAALIALHAEVERLSLQVKKLTGALSEARATLATADSAAVPPSRSGVLTEACNAPDLETLAQQRFAAPLDPVARTTIVRETSLLDRSRLDAVAFSDVTTRVGSSIQAGGSTSNVMETLFNVLRESIHETNEDKRYFLEKLQDYNAIGDALASYLEDLVDASGELSGGSACDAADGDPLGPGLKAEVATRISGIEAMLASTCCATGKDPTNCSFIIDPASCGEAAVKTDIPLVVPSTFGELRALSSFGQAKLAAARTSADVLTRNVAQVTGRISALCQQVTTVLTSPP